MQTGTMDHALRLCKYLPFVFDTVNKCFPTCQLTGNEYSQGRGLLVDCPGDELMPPPGLLAWSGIILNSNIRCKSKFSQCGTLLSWRQLSGNWILHLSGWQLLPATPIPADQLAPFLDALISPRDKGVLDHALLNPQQPQTYLVMSAGYLSPHRASHANREPATAFGASGPHPNVYYSKGVGHFVQSVIGLYTDTTSTQSGLGFSELGTQVPSPIALLPG